MTIPLSQYGREIRIVEPLVRPRPFSSVGEYVSNLETILCGLLDGQADEKEFLGAFTNPCRLLRASLNVRFLDEIAAEVSESLDMLLWTERMEQGIVLTGHVPCIETTLGVSSPLGKTVAFRQGDITRLAADAIVNAANNRLLDHRLPGD
ncbi:MAG: hypothetical protein P4L43_08665 [Syntrophobacteraceae bacterium]|nr:hypothetical protein [Syntrophobacteraceae bacterium]